MIALEMDASWRARVNTSSTSTGRPGLYTDVHLETVSTTSDEATGNENGAAASTMLVMRIKRNDTDDMATDMIIELILTCGGATVAQSITILMPIPSQQKRPVNVATDVISSVGAVVSLSGVDISAAASLAMLSALTCSRYSALGASRFVISFFYDFGFAAVVLGNMGVLVVYAGLHGACTWLVRRCQDVPATACPVVIQQVSRRFPNISFQVCELLLPGITFGVVVCAMQSPSTSSAETAATILGSLFVIAVLCAMQVTLYRLVLPSTTYVPLRIKAASPPPPRIAHLIVPSVQWQPESMRLSYGSLMTLSQRRFVGMQVGLLLSSHVLSIAAGVGVGSEGGQCHILLVCGALHFAYAVVLVAIRPNRSTLDKIRIPITMTLFGVVCFCVYYDRSDAAEWFQSCISLLQVLRLILGVYASYLEDQYYPVAWEEKEEGGAITDVPHTDQGPPCIPSTDDNDDNSKAMQQQQPQPLTSLIDTITFREDVDEWVDWSGLHQVNNTAQCDATIPDYDWSLGQGRLASDLVLAYSSVDR